MIGDHEGKAWKARLSLKKIETNANNFMSSLAAHTADSNAFCNALSEATGGIVEYGCGGSTSITGTSAEGTR